MSLAKTNFEITATRRVIVHTPEPGAGAGQYVAAFAKAIAGAGVPTILFCPGNFAYRDEVQATGTQTVCGPVRETHRAGFWKRLFRNLQFIAQAAPKFRATVRKGDIVHFQFGLRLGLDILFLAIARGKGASVVLTAHDPVPHRWLLPRPFRSLERALLRFEYSLCRHLVVHNEAGKQILTGTFHQPSSAVTVIPHGPLSPLPAGEFAAAPQAQAEPLRLLAFGSLRENKGLHLSIAALQRLQHVAAARPVTLTIAGSLPNFMERDYWARCVKSLAAHPARVEVLERTFADAEIGELFASHDAVLLPYVDFHSESGVAALALSQQRPVLATAAGGLGELLRQADCGILIESPTEDAVLAAIQHAASLPPDLLRRKGWNGYCHLLARRSWQAIGEQTKAVYASIPGEFPQQRARKVVLHTPEPASSAALYVDALSAALTADNVPVRVVCPANHQARGVMERNASIDVRICRERATSTTDSLLRKFAQNLRFVVSSCKALVGALHPGDIAHFQYILHLPFGLAFLLCAKIRRAHIAFTVHDPLPHKFLLPRALRALELGSLSLAYRVSDVLIVHSDAGKQKLVDTFDLPPEKIRVIVHGPYALRQKVQACAETQRLEVLFFGSLRENKGLHLAIQAVQRLALAGVPIRLTIAGQVVNRKEQKYWERCRTLIDPSYGATRLLEKFVPDGELADLFAQCHCFLLPYTTFSSDSGVAYMALANARPIVSTDAGGLRWLLAHSGAGVRIAVASVTGVMAALRQAVDLGPEVLERMGRRGEQWLSAECGWAKVARHTREVYAEFLPELKPLTVPAPHAVEASDLVGSER